MKRFYFCLSYLITAHQFFTELKKQEQNRKGRKQEIHLGDVATNNLQ